MSEEKDNNSALTALENLRMRLLDLTARNRLINFRHTKKGSLRIIDELPDQLVDTLLSETVMSFLPVAEPGREELIAAGYIQIDEESGQEVRLKKDPTAVEWAKNLNLSTAYEVPYDAEGASDDKHTDKAIQTLLYPYELEARLKSLLQTAESAIQEMGANILYMAFGFLQWYDSNNDSARLAPLFLVPVRLHKGWLNPQTKTYEYTLSYSGEDIIPNLSLREKLRADFAMALPDLDENTTPEAYFKEVQELIKDNQPRWAVRRHISMALLNFSKLLMYLDLDPSRWSEGTNIIDHPVTSLFLSGHDPLQEQGNSEPSPGFGEEHQIDDMDGIHYSYPLIDDADSSQHSALIDAVDGKNLVIEGPPGTGKSQTITNLIAAAMAKGKKILFVAEKLAALEVVRRRLDAVNLGEFCLELHSHKSQKRKVLDEVEERLNKHGHYRSPKEITANINRYEELKTILSNHVGRINSPWKKTGKTLHEIFMAAIRYRESLELNPESVHPKGYNGENFDPVMQQRTQDQVEAFVKLYQVIVNQLDDNAKLQDHPWYGVRNTQLQMFDGDRVKSSLEEWQSALQVFEKNRMALAETLDCEHEAVPESNHELMLLLKELECLPVLKGDEFLDTLPVIRGDVLETCHHYLKLFEDIQSFYVSLEEKIGAENLQDISVVDGYLKGREHLNSLVSESVELGRLAESMNRLRAIVDLIVDLEEPLSEIHQVLDEKARQYLQVSESGLAEFNQFIQLVSQLNPSYWKMRDECFENEVLDELLPELRNELEQINHLKNKLSAAFRVESLPDSEDELDKLIGIINTGGFFRWFKGSWRAARQQVLSYAISSQVKFSTLESLLDTARLFISQVNNFNKNQRYQEVLGGYLTGLDTNLTALEDIRQWYKSIRYHYGVGFGKKVPLGDAIIGLSENLARGVRSLLDQGTSRQLNDIIDELGSLKEIFSPVAELQDDTTLLVGNEGIITKILASIDIAIGDCGPLAADNSLSIAELSQRIEMINSLNKAVKKWQRADIDHTLFKGRLGLKPGLRVDNKISLKKLNNTLFIADTLEQQISNTSVLKQIYANPTPEMFHSLATQTIMLRRAADEQINYYEHFVELVELDSADWMSQSGDRLGKVLARNSLALADVAAIQNWLDYIRLREQMVSIGFDNLIEKIEQSEIDIGQINDAYYAGVFDLLAREIMTEDENISRFSGHSQKALQDQFKEYDERLKILQSAYIAWKIDQKQIPEGHRGARVSEHTENVLLKHECTKKTRHIPIRQLLKRAGNALVAIKPCFMMGPMSVAQYLAPGQIEFDLVVMDEASQIKPQDALGAIARGGQLVVVGDPKQLPPTSFFDRVVDDEEDDVTAIEESESILDATLPMFLARRLRWHYRSQHESLIAFSNHSFYDSNLVLFPSPHKSNENYGVQYSRIPRGCFVNRRNMEEAKVISEAVRDHFIHRLEESLGVVAMSADQRLQIERAIETLAKEDTFFQQALEEDANKQEALFVKNLENVQGDERDVIFVSVTYGPQEPGGKVYQRFGPINSDMGWRRLNVLFTRSKKRMHIFSSMGSDDIVADTSSKRGVQALRNFLNFCETGILHKTQRATERGPGSDFEISVMKALQKEGFECIAQVGMAGFFIDVAVVDPGNSRRYLMGIECDGATYHSAKSARDRDRLRQTVLERLGWRIRRIWSTDWFKNPDAELRPIIRELNELKTEPVEEYQQEGMSEADNIDEIIEEVEEQEALTEKFIFENLNLREKLIQFDREVIRKRLPDTIENQRLLRPAMLDAFLEYLPCSKSEYTELMPPYLRQSTNASEGKYLDNILELINANGE